MQDAHLIKQNLEENTQKLLHYLEKVDESILTTHPQPDAWSIAEIFEHISIIDQALVMFLQGPLEKVDRDPTSVISNIKTAFYNFERQYPAPEMISPKGLYKSKADINLKWPEIRKQLFQVAEKVNWEAEVRGFKHFAFGYLTVVEWVYFSIIHAERHLNQMQRTEVALS